jgi:hypothetical protein
LTKNQKSIISNQLQVCRQFIVPEGWTCSYLHIERKAHRPIEPLVRSRGSVGQFDLIVSFSEFFPYGQESVYEISGMISVSNAENFEKGYSKAGLWDMCTLMEFGLEGKANKNANCSRVTHQTILS